MKIILCGYHWAGCKALEMLLNDNHEVFVYTHEAPYYVNSLQDYCSKKNIACSLEKISAGNLPFQPDIIASIYYRYIISVPVIESVKGKIFNLHPSLLPDYRGCSSLTWAMINGERKTGFTYHYIDGSVDTGDIILQRELAIEEFDTQQSLYFKVMFEALKEFPGVIRDVAESKRGVPQSQTGSARSYKRGCPFEGRISDDWDDERSERFIRAMINPPLSPATFKGEEIFSLAQLKQLKS